MDEGGGDNTGLVEVISNSVIIRRLEKYISYDDFKVCRAVCRAFNQSIVEESSFPSRTKLVLKGETFHSRILNNLSFTLRNVDLYLCKKKRYKKPSLTDEKLEPLYRCFNTVESLKIKHEEGVLTENPKKIRPDISRLIRATESLKELELSTWDVNLFLNLKDPTQVIEKLKDVVSLELIPHGYIALNEEGLREIRKLQRVKIQDGYDSGDTENGVQSLRSIGELVVRSADTITSLKITEPRSWTKFSNVDTSCICDTRFPKLRELSIRAGDVQAVEISNFLAAHREQLDSLKMRILGAFPTHVIDGIGQKASKSLKKLAIATNTFDQSRKRNLAFLQECQELESFKLQFIYSNSYNPNCDSIAEIFSYLPTKNLRKLSLIRLPTPLYENIDLLKIEALCGLKHLALDWCEEAVTNSTITAIFKYMTQLEYLRIKKAFACYAAGFTGRKNRDDPTLEPGKVAASNLTKLKHLVLQDCGIDDHIIKVALKFKDLETLDVSGNSQVTHVSCMIAVSQNPSLKVLRTNNFPEKIKRKVLKSLNPRFQSHQMIDEIDHDRDSSDEESEIDEDSDFSNSSQEWDHEDDFDLGEDFSWEPDPEDYYDVDMDPEDYDFVNPQDYDYYFMHGDNGENDGNDDGDDDNVADEF